MCQQPERNVYAPVIHTFSSTCFGGISPHCAMGLCDGCYMKDCACKCHQPAPARCRECGDPLRADQHDSCDWCDGIMPALKTNAGKPLSDEEADALLASRAAKPMQPALTMAQRAAVALPADHTPEEFSIYATSRR